MPDHWCGGAQWVWIGTRAPVPACCLGTCQGVRREEGEDVSKEIRWEAVPHFRKGFSLKLGPWKSVYIVQCEVTQQGNYWRWMIEESKAWGCVPTSTIWSGLHVSVNFFCPFPSASCDKKTKDGPLRSPEGKRDRTTINKKWTNKVLPFWIISHFHCSQRLIINNLTSTRSPRVIMRCFDERLTEGGGYSYRLPNKLSIPWQNHPGNYYSFKIIMILFSPRNLVFSHHHILYNIQVSLRKLALVVSIIP